MPEDVIQHLEHLTKHPGWLWLKSTVLEELRANSMHWVSVAAGDTDDTAALAKLRQVIAAKDAVERAFHRPEEELRKRRQQTVNQDKPYDPSRRGTL